MHPNLPHGGRHGEHFAATLQWLLQAALLAWPVQGVEPAMNIKALLIEAVRSGTIASLVIVPLSPLFKALGLRIGHYGPKFAGLFVEDPHPWMLFVQHLVIGWVSALPLLVILVGTGAGRRLLLAGAVYGGALLRGREFAGPADLLR